MGIHSVWYYAEYDETIGAHELQDINYLCSYFCQTELLDKLNREDTTGVGVNGNEHAGTVKFADGSAIEFGAYPCGSETDYDVHCANCETLLWRGLSQD